MSLGILAGIVDSTKIGASFIGAVPYSSGASIYTLLPAPGAEAMSIFTYLVLPNTDFSPFTVRTLPTVSLSKESTGVRVTASKGNTSASILVFGR